MRSAFVLLVSRFSTLAHPTTKTSTQVAAAMKNAVANGRKHFERLPENVKPINYKLKIEPNLKTFEFSGEQEVKLKVTEATDKIIMNAIGLEVKDASVASGVGGTVSYDKEQERVIFQFPEALAVGETSLKFNFSGTIASQMKGFYRSRYMHNGEERFAAVTQFEATDARRAFPCWDEPAVKATFDVTLVAPADKHALSNMPAIKEEVNGDKKTIVYGTTPVMSTYLVAFIFSDFDVVEGKDKNGIQVRVFTPVGRKEHGQFALDIALKAIPFYTDYFGISYPLPKLDLVTIADFAAGAMENWGLTTYRETAILADPANPSVANKKRVALVVAHEIAHQWFGNLVTMSWWSDLWLNEGFANWIEYLCVDHIFPEWDIWAQFIPQELAEAMALDSMRNSHPIQVEVGHPDEIDEIFDTISYAKGSSVIRMMHSFVTDPLFREGMKHYLTKHKFDNTKTTDLWQALELKSGKAVGELMKGFTERMGYPLVSVELVDNATVKVTQERFSADGPLKNDPELWAVPLTARTKAGGVVIDELVREREATIKLKTPLKDANDWIKFNVDTMGYYRVCYKNDLLARLTKGIADGSLPQKDRLYLPIDLVSMSRAGYGVSAVQALDFIKQYRDEKDYSVWSAVTRSLSGLMLMVENSGREEAADKYVATLFEKKFAELGWEPKAGESENDSQLRATLVALLGACHHAPVVEECRRRFDKHVAKEAPIDFNLRPSIFSAVARNGGQKEHDQLMTLFKESIGNFEQVRILVALGRFKDVALKEKTLKFNMEEVKPQDKFYGIMGVACDVAGRRLAWQWVKNNFSQLKEMFQDGFLLKRFVTASSEDIYEAAHADEVETFFKENSVGKADRAIQQTVERIRHNAKWLEREKEAIAKYEF